MTRLHGKISRPNLIEKACAYCMESNCGIKLFSFNSKELLQLSKNSESVFVSQGKLPNETKLNKRIKMDYYESAEEITITRERALEELENHGISSNSEEIDLFNLELGEKETYEAQDVLAWLGY